MKKLITILGIMFLSLLFVVIPTSAYNVRVDLNDNAIILITLLIVFFVSLFIALRSDGIYKSLIALSGVFLICITVLFREMLIDNNLSKGGIIIISVFSIALLLVGIGMIYIGVMQLFQKSK